MKKITFLFALMALAFLGKAQDFDWQYITYQEMTAPYHIFKDALITSSIKPLSKDKVDKYFMPLTKEHSLTYGTGYQVVIMGKLELEAGKRAVLYAIYPSQNSTKIYFAPYLLAIFDKDGKGITFKPITSYKRGGNPGKISILEEDGLYAVYVTDWEDTGLEKKLKTKFDKQGNFK